MIDDNDDDEENNGMCDSIMRKFESNVFFPLVKVNVRPHMCVIEKKIRR